MANKADTSFNAATGPMMMQLERAKRDMKNGRSYKGTSQKAVKRGAPLADGKKSGREYNGTSQKATHSTITHGTKPRYNPEKNPSGGTGINTKFDDYAPRGYYPTRKGETRVLEPSNGSINVQPRKLKEKG